MFAATELRFEPHEDKGRIRAFILAVVMHCALLAFLYFGISWTNQPAAPAQADLWTALPPMSAPPPRVEPPPPPPEPKPQPKVVEPEPAPPPPVKADIVQKAEKKKEEPKKVPPPKPAEKKPPPPPPKVEKEPPPKPQEKPQPDPMKSELERMQRELSRDTAKNDMQRAMAKEGQQKAAAPSSGNSDAWTSKVAALVRSKVPSNIANAVPGNPTAVFEVTVLPGREVGLVKLVRSSGYPAYDEAAQHAIEATTPLPPPTAGMGEIPHTLRFEATPKDK